MSGSSTLSLIEALESRIAPAGVIIKTGVPGHFGPTPSNPSGETDYMDFDTNTTPPTDTTAADNYFVALDLAQNPNDPIVQAVGTTPNGYYLKLFSGDKLQVDVPGSSGGLSDFISGPNGTGIVGNLVAFFVDGSNGNPLDNEVQVGELTGVALGAKTSVVIAGTVNGDVVSNYNDSDVNVKTRTGGKLGGTGEAPGVAQDLLHNPITNLAISGNVAGKIMSGGNISAVKVIGNVSNILGGTAANGQTYDFNGIAADGGDTINPVINAPAAKQAGVSISNVNVVSAGTIEAGAAGASAIGGSLTSVNIIKDTDGIVLRSGAGGDGTAASPKGGNAGNISTVLIQGLAQDQSDPTANDAIQLIAAKGGDASGTAGTGVGGKIFRAFVGYETLGGRPSVTALQDSVLVQGGLGGAGKIGNTGGSLSDIHIVSAPSGAGNNIELHGGDGGAVTAAGNVAGSKAGMGGSIITVEARNVNPVAAAQDSKVIVDAGNGGVAMSLSAGGIGGGITSAKVLGFDITLTAGDGTAGNTSGGAGGAIRTVVIEDFINIRAQAAQVIAGAGGAATAGKGGVGGLISGLTINNADVLTDATHAGLVITGGAGGNSGKGIGAAGGAVSGLRIVDITGANTGTMMLTTGKGGDGLTGGGTAGQVSDTNVEARDLNFVVTTGNGGTILAGGKGKGGNAGAIVGVALTTRPLFDPSGNQIFENTTGTITTGTGGNGADKGAGGAGGDMSRLNATMDGSVTVTAGAGGDAGANAAAGKGGSVLSSFAESRNTSVAVTAGNAGTNGVGLKGGAGGSIVSTSTRAATTVSLRAGDGTNGGPGGNLTSVAFSNPNLLPTSGDVTLRAGDSFFTVAATSTGNGGSITNATGFVGTSGTTLIQAGSPIQTDAGTSVTKKPGAGGSIASINLYGGGGPGVLLNIEAGSAAVSAPVNAPAVTVGGAGGSVRGVTIGNEVFDPANPSPFALDEGTILHHIAAGNGGNTSLAKGKGGAGGTIDQVYVNHDIGVRSGRAFGFDPASMGGLFAGSGGINTTISHADPTFLDPKLDGAAGNVTNVSADAISAIVAGRPVNGSQITKQNLVTKVDRIFLNGTEATRVHPTFTDQPANTMPDPLVGAYRNFDTANLVGGNHSADPNNTPHADTFDPSPTEPFATAPEYVDGPENPGTFGIGDLTNANTDGFIAAITLTNNRNFVPEAFLTVAAGSITKQTPNGTGSNFVDYNHTNGQPTTA